MRGMLKSLVKKLRSRPETLAVYVFGSYARGKHTIASDVDVAVILDPYDEYLASEIEISAPKGFDVLVLNRANPMFIYEVLKNGKVVYCRDKDRLYEKRFELAAVFRRSLPVLLKFGLVK